MLLAGLLFDRRGGVVDYRPRDGCPCGDCGDEGDHRKKYREYERQVRQAIRDGRELRDSDLVQGSIDVK